MNALHPAKLVQAAWQSQSLFSIVDCNEDPWQLPGLKQSTHTSVGHSGGPWRHVLHSPTLLQLPVREQMLLLLSKVKNSQLLSVLHRDWHSHSSFTKSEPTVLPLQRPTSKQSTQADGEAVVVVVAGQTLGPLVQLVQVVRLVQLPIRLHIPFVESKVKSVHDGSPAHKT